MGLLSGCQEPIDSDIGTDSIHAAMRLTSTGDGTTRVVVTLSASGSVGTDILLVQGDRLVAVANGQSQPLMEDQRWPHIVRYFTVFNFDDPGMLVTISFERGTQHSHYVSAPNSNIVLPENIAILAPQSGETFTRQESILVSWEPSGGSEEIAIQFTTTCQSGDDFSSGVRYFTVSDSGSESYAVEDLLSEQDVDANATCTADIMLVRETTGSLAAEYKGGTIVARREASVSVEIAP